MEKRVRKLKVGVVGCGLIAKLSHIPAIRRVPEVDLTFVVDSKLEWAKETARRFLISNFSDNYADLFGNVDLVIVATPNSLHSEISCALLENGIHVLCEKPMEVSFDKCKKMIDSQQKSKKILMIGHNRRFASNAKLLNEFINEGYFGEIKELKLVLGHKHTSWPSQSKFGFNKILSGGGVLIDQGIHLIDLLIWLSKKGYKVKGAEGKDILKTGMEDYAKVKVEFENGGIGIIETSRIKELNNICEIKGERGWGKFHIDNISFLEIFSEDIKSCKKTRNSILIKTAINNTHFDQFKHFLECIYEKKSPLVDGGKAAQGIKMIEECYKVMRLTG